MGNCIRHKFPSRHHDTVRFLLSWPRSVRTSRLPESALHPSKPYACPSPRLLWTRSVGDSHWMATRCSRYTSSIIASIQGQVAVRGYVSEATTVIVQLAGLRFRHRCSLSKLGRHRTSADASRSASGYGGLLLDGLKRDFPLNIMGSREQRSLSSSLLRFLKSRSKGCLR